MTEDELIGKLKAVQKMKSESNTLELKSAENGCPQHLYDSLSSFQIRMKVESSFLELMRSRIIKKWEFMTHRIYKKDK